MSLALYQKEILNLAAAGEKPLVLADADISVRVDNPLCGDRVTIDITLTDDRITGIGHKVQGCALCQASAALIAAEVVGATGSEISAASEQLTKFIADEDDAVELSWPKMAVFAPVREFKNRLECLKLPFTAVLRAISNVKNPPAGKPGSD
jgi:nitrogen fixation NifU-like protein